MKSKVKLTEAKLKFPKLMINKQYDFIVLFERIKEGVVLFTNEKNQDFPSYHIGHYSAHWIMDRFEDFNGKLTLKN